MSALDFLRGPRRRPRVLIAVAAGLAVLIAALATVLVVTLGGSPGSSSASAPSSSPSSSPSPSTSTSTSETADESSSSSASPTPGMPEQTGPVNADEPPPNLPAVSLDASSDSGDGVSARLSSIEAIDGRAVGPGNVSGPALRVTVRIENGTSAAISLDEASINMFYGAELTPASPLEDASRAPLTGTLAPGESVEGVYVFSVPDAEREQITVEVGHRAGAPLMIFAGPVD